MINISGFTFIKDGLSLGYPISESIRSIEDICDEIIINVGFDDPGLIKDDGTWNYLNDHFNTSKFKFVKSWWDPKLKANGEILGQQTNISLSKCQGKYCQYIQGDEVIHENDLTQILSSVKLLEQDKRIEGLVFNYLHFYGNTNIIKYTRNMYRREVRLIRNNLGIKSWKDAQGFRSKNNEKLKCKLTNATVLHYGWARKESVMDIKNKTMSKLYHGDKYSAKHFKYSRLWGLRPFENTHPFVMKNWIKKNENELDIMALPLIFSLSDTTLVISDLIEKISGFRLGEYKNYQLL